MDHLRDAVANYWVMPESGSVLAGRSQRISQLIGALADELVTRGVDRTALHHGAKATLPGAYGSETVVWDLTITSNGVPVAAVEIMGVTGPFVNVKNRLNDRTAAAFSVRRQYASEELAPLRPHLALLVIADESEDLRRPRGARTRSGRSHESPYEFIERAIAQFAGDRLFDSVGFAVTSQSGIEEPHEALSLDSFVGSIVDSVNQRQASDLFDPVSFGEILANLGNIDDVLTGLTSTPFGMQAAEMAVIRRRRAIVAQLRELALDTRSNETAMQNALEGHHWIFGGQYIGVAARRDLMNLQQHDIPLVSADRSLNIVELKGPEAPLVKRPRKNHLVTSTAIHDAVGQCMNYLRTFDELGAPLETLHRNDLGLSYDYRRARATVVIGHPERDDSASREQIDQVIRTYNAHLSRIQVVTYADLLETAERALAFEEQGQADDADEMPAATG